MKERLDVILVEKGLSPSRDKAKRSIMAGLVTVDGRVESKAGQRFDPGQDFALKAPSCPYVSRGGLKLEKALQSFPLGIADAVCADIGASTGGFTDCMLQHGARRVYAIDVGYGQLDYRLRIDSRVINIEKTNVRYLDTALVPEPVDLVSIDVSFISLRHILPVAAALLADSGSVLALIKPEFEAGRDQVGKKGIVRDPLVQQEVIERVLSYAADNSLYPHGLTHSPVKGSKGNIEFLLWLRRDAAETVDPAAVIAAAHETLDNET